MKQPELGLKVAELRQQKGLTQEKLAEMCEVSSRTIQRIESGEVDPRLCCLPCALPYPLSWQVSFAPSRACLMPCERCQIGQSIMH
jgi:DNA-binding XRE family transcriptional regulator